jgi:pyruvate dehydrogenase E2 component (dihydrolipoamide acetyltransferase)
MKLPELGENIEGGDVLRVMVKPGEAIKKDQPVLELETDKATIEVPSSADGVVKEIKVKPGEKVKVGQTIFTVDENGAGAAEPADAAVSPKAPAPEQESSRASAAQGPSTGQAKADAPEAPKARAPEAAKTEPKVDAQPPKAEKRKAEVVEMKPGRGQAPPAEEKRQAAAPAAVDPASIPAAPSARRLARELGVNIADIQGSGSGGRISMDDVTAFARRLLSGAGAGAGRATTVPAEALPDFGKWGAVERKPMSGVRRTTAHRLTHAWSTVPHVFQHDRADITGVEALRKRLSKRAEAEGRAPITITAFLMKTLAAALKKFPQLNASVDMQTDEIIYKHYAHIGVAVDTDRGLLVPVIRDVDQKDIFQVADEIAQAAERARSRKLSLDDMQGGSITISNLGSLGGGAFTPIVNWPEVAILGVARARMEPVYTDTGLVPRFLMPLTLSYDHRVVDGADGVRILRWIVEAVEQPALIWLDV